MDSQPRPCAAPAPRPAWNIYDAFEDGTTQTAAPSAASLTMEERLARRVFLSFFADKGLFAHLIESYDDMLRVTLPHMMAEFGLIIVASERTQSLHIFCILPPTEIRKPQKREKLGYVTDLTLREARDRGLSYEGAVVTDVVHEVWKPRPGAEPIILPRKDGSTPREPADPDSAPPAISTMRPLPGVRPVFGNQYAVFGRPASEAMVPGNPPSVPGNPPSVPDNPSAAVPEITTQLLMAMAGLEQQEFFSGTSPLVDGILSPTAQWTMDESSSGIHARVPGLGDQRGEVTTGCRPDPARFELASRTVSKDAKLFTLPIMVGSARCHTRDAPPAPSEPWNRTEGYCVVNGMEKIFMPQLNPIANRILVHAPHMKNETQLVTGEMRCRHWAKIRSTATICVNVSSSYRGTGMVTATLGGIVGIDKAIPLFALCRMIGFRTVVGTAYVIARRGTVLEPARPASDRALGGTDMSRFELWLQSMLRNRHKGDPDFEAMSVDDIMLWVGDNCLAKKSTSTIAAAMAANSTTATATALGAGLDDVDEGRLPGVAAGPGEASAMRKSTQHYLCNEFMPHVGMEMSDLTLRNKRALLAYMVWRVCKVVRHELPHDERDHFGNQMIETPGRLTILLFRQLYRNALTKRTVRTLKLNADTGRHFGPAECIPSRRLSQDMGYAMSTGSWGVHKGGSARKGIMQILKRVNPLSTLSNLRSARKPGELKDMAPRLLGVHDWGIACPSETTEGENCGLLKHLAAHAYVTQGRPTRALVEMVLLLLGDDLQPVAHFQSAEAESDMPFVPGVTFLLNGIYLGVIRGCSGKEAAERLRAARRRRVLPFDVEIAFREPWELHVSCENGAVRRPLFVVDRDPAECARRVAEIAAVAEAHPDAGAELFRELVRRGLVEFLGKNEEQEMVVRASPYAVRDEAGAEAEGEPGAAGEAGEREARERSEGVSAGAAGAAGAAVAELCESEVLQLAESLGVDGEELLRRERELRARLRASGMHDRQEIELVIHSARREFLLFKVCPAQAAETARESLAVVEAAAADLPTTDPLRLQPYTHYEIHPMAIHSLATGQIPFSNHNQAPRNTYQCAMGKAAMGEPQEADESRASMRLPEAQIPLAATAQEWMMNPRYMRSGKNVIVAILCKDGNNQEDSLNMCSADFQLGLYRSWEYTLYSDTAAVTSRGDPQAFERPGDDVWGKRDVDYSLLGEEGYAEPGTIVVGGSAVIGKTVRIPNGKKRDQSTLIGESEPPGTVVSVVEAESRDRRRIKVQVARPAVPIVGDKFSARHGQKGVIGDKLPREDMPWGVLPMQVRDERGRVTGMRFTEIRPNILMNPNAIPSRMTIGQLLGIVAGTAAAAGGYVADGTSFVGGRLTVDEIRDELKRLGLNPQGTMRLNSGVTGEELANVEVFMGVDYWQRLKQEAAKKMRAVDQGDRSAITRQPMEGKRGGLRAGEMEQNAFVAHGAREIVTNTFLERSDDYVAYACTKCGMLACPPRQPDPRMNHLPSLKDTAGYCTYCRSAENVARFRTPYALKLMMQELMALGIVPRVDIQASEDIVFANAPAAGVPASDESLPRAGVAIGGAGQQESSGMAAGGPSEEARSAGAAGGPSEEAGAAGAAGAAGVPSEGAGAAGAAGAAGVPSKEAAGRYSEPRPSGRRAGPDGAVPVRSLPGGVRVRGPDIVRPHEVELLRGEEWAGGSYG
jgi:DNA-directed RNA polymerase beta subunit